MSLSIRNVQLDVFVCLFVFFLEKMYAMPDIWHGDFSCITNFPSSVAFFSRSGGGAFFAVGGCDARGLGFLHGQFSIERATGGHFLIHCARLQDAAAGIPRGVVEFHTVRGASLISAQLCSI